MKKINNYRWQQQQQAKLEHQKVKKIKKEAEKLPVSAAEELEYINKLLSGEEVEDFGPKEVENDASSVSSFWSINPSAYSPAHWISDPSKLTLTQYLDMMSGKGYYR
jgi:hypothetical protein